MMRSHHPVVVIGGGVAGLAAAHRLARDGIAVRVFEFNDRAGGCCSSTTLAGYTFNEGALFLGFVDLLDHAFARIGLDRGRLLPLRKITALSSTTLPDGSVVTLGEGFDLSVTGRTVDAKRVESELRALVDAWRPVVRFAGEELLRHPFSPLRTIQKGWRHLARLRGTVADECRRRLSDPAVRSALSGSLLYTGLPAGRMPVSAILGLVSSISDGLYLPEGGMGRLPVVLHRGLTDRGVPLSLGSPVDRILIENGRAHGVQLRGGERVDAGAVISTVSGMSTFTALIDDRDVPASLRRRVARAPLSHRSVSIQLGLSNRIEAPAHTMSVLPWMEDQAEIFRQDGRELEFPVYTVPTVTMPELAAAGGSIIEMYYPVRDDISLDDWPASRREELTEMFVSGLRRTQEINVAVSRVRTPRNFRDDLHLFGGALYGLTPAATPRQQFPHATPIPGLFMAGQTTFPGYGVATAMMSGVFAAEAVAADLGQAGKAA